MSDAEYKRALYFAMKGSEEFPKMSDVVVGDLACYCKYLKDKGGEYQDTTFEDIESFDKTKYCQIWSNYQVVEFFLKLLVPVFIIVVNALMTNFNNMIMQLGIPFISTVD